MNEELKNGQVIVIEDNSDVVQHLSAKDGDSPPVIEHQFQLPYNKSVVMIVLSAAHVHTLIRNKSEQLFHSTKHESRDGQLWRIELTLESSNPQNVNWYMQFKADCTECDDTKAYKIMTTLQTKGFKKRKDTKKTLDSRQFGYGISVPLTAIGESPFCIEVEFTVETSIKYNSRDEVGYTGLVNVSSLCYMNSVFQILFHLTEFKRLVFQVEGQSGDEFPGTLQGLFHSLMTNRSSVSTQDIIRSFKWDYEQQTVQHDVHEFTIELLRGVNKRLESQKHIAKQIQDLFEGILENHLEGTKAKFDKVNTEEFMDIQLPVEDCHDLKQAFDVFFMKELLDGDNAIQTDDFGKQPALKYHKFKKLPPVLMINLRRYKYDPQTFALMKINDRFAYTRDIELQDQEGKHQYTLFGVLIHRGELIHHGHYYCFIKTHDCGWLKFDDKVVTKVTEQQVYDNNFGGTYQAGEFNPDLGQVVLSEQQSPETAYMLVYIKKACEKQLLQGDVEIPNWIQQKEEEISKRIELGKYLQVQVIVFEHLNQMPYEGIRNGLLFHKRAPNSNIDSLLLQREIDKLSLTFNLPKNFTCAQTAEYLSQHFQQDISMFLYKITSLKPNSEQLFSVQRIKRPFSQILNTRVLFKCMIVFAKNALYPRFKELTNTSQEHLIEFKNEPLLVQEQEEKELTVVFQKDFSQQMAFQSYQIVDYNTPIEEIPHKRYFLYESELQEAPNGKKTQVKDLLNVQKSTFLQTVDDAQKWSTSFNQLREVVFRNQQTQQQFTRILNKNDDYWTLVRAVADVEGYEVNHVILKTRGKKGAPLQVKGQEQSLDELIQFDNCIIYLYSPVSVFDLKTQFAISYEVQAKGQRILFDNIICSKDTLIDDLQQLAHGKGHLDLLLKESIKNQKQLDGNNPNLIVPLFGKKKTPLDITIGTGCKYNLQRLKGQYMISFTMVHQMNNGGLQVIVKLVSKEGILIVNPMVIEGAPENNPLQFFNYALSIIQQPVEYSDEYFTLKPDEIIVMDAKQNTRTLKQEMTVFMDYDSEEKLVEKSDQPMNEIFPKVTKQASLHFTLNSVQDMRAQKMRQQGVQLNL